MREDPEYRKRITAAAARHYRLRKKRKKQSPAYHERINEKRRAWWCRYVECETEEHHEQWLAKRRERTRARFADPAYRDKDNAHRRDRAAARGGANERKREAWAQISDADREALNVKRRARRAAAKAVAA